MDSIAEKSSSRPAGPARAPGRSVLVGLIGKGIQLSRTPAMHEAEGWRQGLNYTYRLLDTDLMGAHPPHLADLLRFAECFGLAGVNVTHPFKQDVLALLDELAPQAVAVGSVNTVVFADGRRIGHNTDLWGFRESFARDMAGAPRDSVVLLGAGGAGAAVAHALLESDAATVQVYDVDKGRAIKLADRLTARFGQPRAVACDDVAVAAAHADGIVNATPVGMARLPGVPLAIDLIEARHWVADIVYFPLETEFLRAARGRGCRTMSGENMAVFQAAQAFRLFTGINPDIDRMRASFAAWREPPAA